MNKQQRYVDDKLSDPAVQAQFVANPQQTYRQLLREAMLVHPLQEDRFIYRAVVLILGLVVLVFGGLYFYLIFNRLEPIPDAFISISSAALGALTGLLAPSPSQREDS